MPLIPSDIPVGTITGQFYLLKEDGTDSGTSPDLTPAQGTVIFTASVPTLSVPGKQSVVIPRVFYCPLDSTGKLFSHVPGVELPATNSLLIDPLNYTWRVDFDLHDPGTGFKFPLESFDFSVPVGETNDLSVLRPVSTSPGVITIKGPPGDKGDQGIPGPFTDLSVGTVTKIAPGGTPTVSVTGPDGNKALNFGLVTGDKGNKGDDSTVPGPAGPPGTGVPSGGAALQYVRRNTANTDTEWATLNWEAVADKPTEFPPESHTHTIAQVTGLQTALDGKASTAAVTTTNNGLMIAADKVKLNAASAAATPSTIVMLDAAGRAKVANPSAATDIVNKQYADALVKKSPAAMDAGRVFIAGPVAAGGVSGTVPVTFTAGYFTAEPALTFGTNDPRVSPNITGLSATGFNLRAFNYTTAATTASPTVWWIAATI